GAPGRSGGSGRARPSGLAGGAWSSASRPSTRPASRPQRRQRMAEPLRVALIDDHGLCRRGLGELLELRAGMKVVATTGNPQEGIGLIQEHKPDLAVIDLRMPQLDGLRVLRGR